MGQEQSSTLAQINNLIASGTKAGACDAECQNLQTQKELYNKLLDAKTNLVSAPDQVKTAEKNYYTFSEGPTGYQRYNTAQIKAEAALVVQGLKKDFDEKYNDSVDINKLYQSLYVNEQNTQQLYQVHLDKNVVLQDQIDEKSNDIYTNDRKSFYENQELESLKGWHIFGAWIYAIIVISYFICMFFIHSRLTMFRRFLILLVLIIYPIISTRLSLFIIKKIYYLWSFLPKNVYM